MMAKTNAEHQKGYRERKKAAEGSKYLQKKRLRQKKHTKVKDLLKRELKERREAVRKRVQKYLQYPKAMQRILEMSGHNTSSDTVASSP